MAQNVSYFNMNLSLKMDSYNSPKYKPALDETIRENEVLENQNLLYKSLFSVIGILIVAFALYFILYGNDTHYEKGFEYTRNKQYSEAIIEFQKVEPDDKDFSKAQSKINYVNGVMASEKGLKSEALLFLSKVDPSDEYYAQSRLLIANINSSNKKADLEILSEKVNNIKDTVIIKNITEEASQETASDAATSLTNSIPFQKLIPAFEKQYNLAENSSVEKKNNYLIQMDSLYSEFAGYDISKETNSLLLEITKTTLMWMQIRIELINKQLSSVSESDFRALQSIKKEGDSTYLKLQKLLNQYANK